MAFAKFGTPFPSVVFCPIRLLIGLWGEERETDLLELHISNSLFAFSKGIINSYYSRKADNPTVTWPQKTDIGLSEAFLEQFSIKRLTT